MPQNSLNNMAVELNWSRKWLEPYDWDHIVWLNARLCENKQVIHQATSDGHDQARMLWEQGRHSLLRLDQALMIAYECHQLAPFAFFNGNTLVAVARQMIEPLLAVVAPDDPNLAAQFRAVVGHFVAGTEGMEELQAGIAEMAAWLNRG